MARSTLALGGSYPGRDADERPRGAPARGGASSGVLRGSGPLRDHPPSSPAFRGALAVPPAARGRTPPSATHRGRSPQPRSRSRHGTVAEHVLAEGAVQEVRAEGRPPTHRLDPRWAMETLEVAVQPQQRSWRQPGDSRHRRRIRLGPGKVTRGAARPLEVLSSRAPEADPPSGPRCVPRVARPRFAVAPPLEERRPASLAVPTASPGRRPGPWSSRQ